MAAELGEAYVNIIPKAPGIEKELKGMFEGSGDAAATKSGASLGKKLLGGLKTAVAAGAVGKVLKDAFEAGGNLQQSFGGLDTIYGDASAAAKEYAKSAASAGISANSYAEQAVSFGAALKAAYGGDTTAAMEAANTAILDMADNAAKMGTPLESIQYAYQGFAKQNYTMLDNLKLGYGGTKQEMERLLSDAEQLTGIKYDINNLGDVYDAVHVIQGELGLTGTAALEARTTLTGSFGAMKASWENLLAAMTTGEGLDQAMQNLATTAGDLLTNVLQMAGSLVAQLPALLSGLGSAILSAAPQLLESGVQIALQLASGIIAGIPQLLAAAPQIITSLLQTITANAGTLIEGGTQLIGQLEHGIIASLPQIIAGAASIVGNLLAAILVNSGTLLTGGVELIVQIVTGFITAIPQLIEQVPVVFADLAETFVSQDWASIGNDVINGIINGIKAAASALLSALRDLAGQALSAAKNALGIASPSKLFASEVGKWIPRGMAVGIEANLSPVDTSIQRMAAGATAEFERATAPGATASRDTGTGYAAASGSQAGTNKFEIVFTGSLAQLGRVLSPYIKAEDARVGPQYVT